MRYIGSKASLSSWIYKIVENERIAANQPKEECIFYDIMAGMCHVAKKFREECWGGVVTNDALLISYAHQLDILYRGLVNRKAIVDSLNRTNPIKGIVYRQFSGERMYFTLQNAMKLDGALNHLTRYKPNTPSWAAAARIILDAMSKVANTTGVYDAFLKTYQPNAIKDVVFVDTNERYNDVVGRAYNLDVLESIQVLPRKIVTLNGLIAKPFAIYLDPPYNNRDYSPVYHVPEIALRHYTLPEACSDEDRLYGKTGLLPYKRSGFAKANPTPQGLLIDIVARIGLWQVSQQPWIIVMSYSSDGTMSEQQIATVLSVFGKVKRYKKTIKKYKSHHRIVGESVEEWLFVARNRQRWNSETV